VTAGRSQFGAAAAGWRWPRALESAAAATGRLELSLLLTLLLLVFYPPRHLHVSLPLSAIALVAILMPPLRRSRILWLLAALLAGASAFAYWQETDNHKYLLAYWCLAICCCLCTRDPDPSLAATARGVLAAVFSLAVLQKVISGDYLTSGFFHFALLFDERFAWLARHVGGVSEFSSELNESARRALVNYDSVLAAVKLSSESGTLPIVARFVTWWTVALEGTIALAHMVPRSTWLSRWRHPLLLFFVFSTYLFAPVIGFGWLMIILGVAQLEPSATRMRLVYLLSIVVLQAYKYPWSSLLGGG
jgi:hypothetical protein